MSSVACGSRRARAQVAEAAEKEWEEFKVERTAGIEEISRLRQRVAEEETRKKIERRDEPEEGDAKMAVEGGGEKPSDAGEKAQNGEAKMDVDDGAEKKDTSAAKDESAVKESTVKEEKEKAAGKDEKKMEVTPTPGPGYDDDAVEY